MCDNNVYSDVKANNKFVRSKKTGQSPSTGTFAYRKWKQEGGSLEETAGQESSLQKEPSNGRENRPSELRVFSPVVPQETESMLT